MIAWLLGTRIGRLLSAAAGALLAALGILTAGIWLGGKKNENKALRDANKRTEKGRDHLRDNRDKPNADRLRDNDSRW